MRIVFVAQLVALAACSDPLESGGIDAQPQLEEKDASIELPADGSVGDVAIADSSMFDSSIPDSSTMDGGIPDAAMEMDAGEPFACEGTTAPYVSFNAFWTALDQSYALFDLRLPNDDWTELGRAACAQLSDDMTDDALFDVLIGLARNLDDGHVQLTADALGRDEDAWVSVYPYYEETYELEGNAEDNYLEGFLTYAAEDEFAWGTIGDVGYLSITSMDELSLTGDEEDDRAAANAAMASAVADLGATRGMVVDVRANEGGWDSVALEVAAWFAGPRSLAWSKRRRDGPAHDDFTDWEYVFVEASGAAAYANPVVVLTSGGTFSAGETFALAMRERANVMIAGERSSGHFSDLTDGVLPNGWDFTFSGERYRAADNMIYETLGVPVDAEVALDAPALAAGQDVILEAALLLLP